MSLNTDQRVAILSFIAEGEMSNDQIAQQVGVSLGTVAAVRANLTMGRYTVVEPSATVEDPENTVPTAFSLEKDMQAAIRANISQLENGLIVSDGGKERVTGQGWRIDITAKDATGKTVIIELKAGTATPEALTQVMAYVGEIASAEGALPRAILIAQDFHKKVKAAASVIPNLELKSYDFKFSFGSVPTKWNAGQPIQ